MAFVAFDILQERFEDMRTLRLSERRKRLDKVTADLADSLLQLIVQVDDALAATSWLEKSLNGIEGVVAKLDEPYPKPNVRRWQKVRRQSTMDVLVVGFVGEPRDSPRLVLGRRQGDELQVIGSTLPIGRDDSAVLLELVPSATHGERPIWTPFVKERIAEWYRLPTELVAEVVVSQPDGGMLRQPARFRRWRVQEPGAKTLDWSKMNSSRGMGESLRGQTESAIAQVVGAKPPVFAIDKPT